MKNIKKNAVKIVVLIALFAPAAFADGDMTGGGLSDNGDGTNTSPLVTQTCDVNAVANCPSSETSDTDSFLNAIYEYLNSLI